MNEIIARFKTESPKFFKNLALFGRWIVAVGLSLIAAKLGAPDWINPGFISALETIGGYMVFGGGLIVTVSSLTVDNKAELHMKINKPSKPE